MCCRFATRFLVSLGLTLIVGAGCNSQNPYYCEDDSDCAAGGSGQGVDPANTRCHPLGHGCYPGCRDSSDCTNPDLWWVQPDWPACLDGDCLPALAEGAACEEDGVCASGHCVDGICCDRACAGTCEACNLDGSEGTCTVAPEGAADPACAGTVAACSGRCGADGSCVYPGPDDAEPMQCAATCASNNTLRRRFCDGSGGCGTASVNESCGATRCTAEGDQGARCPDGCVVHADCVTASACDRRLAHGTGQGTCVDLTAIAQTLNDGDDLKQAIDTAITPAKPFLRLNPGLYQPAETIAIGSDNVVRLIGMFDGATQPTVEIVPTADVTVFDASGSATVSLQGIRIGGGFRGANCVSAVVGAASVTLAETWLQNLSNLAVSTTDCALVVRRSRVSENAGGGIRVTGGALTLDSTVVRQNGTGGVGGSAMGGVSFASLDEGTIRNNTIVENMSRGSGTSGLACDNAAHVVTSSIVWADETQPTTPPNVVSATCQFLHSNVQGLGDPLGTNIRDKPLLDPEGKPGQDSPCIDKGTASPWVWDLVNATREQGAVVDIGAFEVR